MGQQEISSINGACQGCGDGQGRGRALGAVNPKHFPADLDPEDRMDHCQGKGQEKEKAVLLP